jgi:serine/threonine-protein kinase
MPHAPDLSGCALDERYELHAVIGEGAFGRVYRGWDRRLERRVAIKMIKPWWAEDPDWAGSFERETRLLARISHPGIVQIFDVGQAPEGLYYVSELVDGESLAQRLKEVRPTPWEAAALTEQLCRALAQAHAARVIHRDVKPANILITRDGRVKVGDFGVARLAEGSTDGASATIVGTPRYMAPEQARGRRATPATDVYSVGVVLYELLAGEPPFTEHVAVELALRHLNDTPDPLPAGTPAGLEQIVARALAKDPAHRYADGAAMADALGTALEAAPAETRSAAVRQRPRHRSRQPERARSLVTTGGGAEPRAPRRNRGEGPPRRRASGPRPATDGPPPTRRAPKLSARRNLNPAARRRSIAALTFAFAVLGAMIAAALVIGATAHVRVPRLVGVSLARARARATHVALHPTVHRRFDRKVRRGFVVSQSPAPHTRVAENTRVALTVSLGPPPVVVPQLAGEQVSQAEARLRRLGLTARTTLVIVPGVPAGEVTSQSPAPGAKLTPSHSVQLNVAEAPRWRPLTSMSGSAQTTSTVVRIRGTQWRLVYTMGYHGTCTFIFWCSGPNAEVDNVSSGSTVSSFGLNDGGRQTKVFNTGPGDYRVSVSPGSDTAGWQVWVEDYF